MDNQQYRPNLLDLPISVFANCFAKEPEGITTLRRIVSREYNRAQIETIRAEVDEVKQKNLKDRLRAFSPVALLHHRKAATTYGEKIDYQWPLLMGDVDTKDNPGLNMAELKKHLCRLPYVLLCAYSVRGGLWFVVRLPDNQTSDTLAAHFRYLQRVFTETFKVKLDSSKGGNPTDLRFVSYDAAPFFNEQVSVMSGTYTPRKTKPRSFVSRQSNNPDGNELLNRLLRFVEGSTEGERHQRLLKAATVAGGYIEAGRMDETAAVYGLETVVSEWPTFSKSQKTIRDGIRHGLTKPIYPDAHPPPQASPIIVRSIAEQLANPGSILKPYESDLERFTVDDCDNYPTDWDM
ncbi:hypothetical protein GCM10027592_03400 [Spirosoma flavus]